MISKDDDRSPPERDRTANRRWMIGLVISLVFGIFGAVMALLSYMDKDGPTTIYRNRKSPPAAPSAAPGASPPAAAPAPSADPAPAAPSPSGDEGKGNDKDDKGEKDDKE